MEGAARQIGSQTWAIAEGYIPSASTGEGPALESHEAPYRVAVPPRRTLHVRFNDLDDPEPVPRDTGYAAVISSDRPIVVQHTRLDSRQPALALLSTVAHPSP
jgi:hypothetical protein